MSGFDNEVVYGIGLRLEPSTTKAVSIMQKTADDVSHINHTGNPEGVVSANPSSLSHDPVSGNIYLKQTGTGTTGWVLIGTTAGDLHTSAFIVSASGTVGTGANYSTIASAVAAASSGDTIFIMRGTYTENLTISKNLIFYSYDTSFRTANPNVQITGKITVSSAVNVQFFGIQFNTNADNSFLLSAAGNITCQNCYFNATNANSILVSAAGNFYIENCSGNFALNRSLFRSTAGVVWLKNSVFIDFVNSPVANTILDSTARIINCYLGIKFITEGTGGIIVENCNFGSENAFGAIWLSIEGSGTSFVDNSTFNSGAAACIEVTTALTITNCRLESSQNFVITGGGTVTYGPLTFSGATSVMQATQVPLITQLGSLNILTPSTVTSPQSMVRDSVTGAVGVGGSSGLVLLGSFDLTGLSEQAFTSMMSSTYRNYLLKICNLYMSGNNRPTMVISQDNGATYLGANYTFFYGTMFGGGGFTSVGGGSQAAFYLSNNSANSNNQPEANFDIDFFSALGSNSFTYHGRGMHLDTISGLAFNLPWGFMDNLSPEINAIKLVPESGTFQSGFASLYGYAK